MRAIIIFISLFFFLRSAGQQNRFEEEYSVIGAFYSGDKTDCEPGIALCESILSKDSTQDLAKQYKGLFLGKLGRFEEAALIFEGLAEKDNEIATYAANAGFFYLLADQYERSIKYSEKSYKTEPSLYHGYLNKGHALLFRQNQKEALYWYAMALDRIANLSVLEQSPVANFNYFKKHKNLEVADFLSSAFRLAFEPFQSNTVSNNILDSIQQLASDFSGENIPELLTLKQRFIDLHRSDSGKRVSLLMQFHLEIGRHQLYNGSVMRAVKDHYTPAISYARARRDSIVLFDILANLSRDIIAIRKSHEKSFQNDDAVFFAENALKVVEEFGLTDRYYQAYYRLGEANSSIERSAKAIVAYKQALDYLPEHETDFRELLFSRVMGEYADLGNTDSATKYYDKLITSYKNRSYDGRDYVVTRQNFLTVLYNSRNYKESIVFATGMIRDLEKRSEFRADLAMAFSVRGDSHYWLNDFEKAAVDLEKAIQLYYEHSEEHFRKTGKWTMYAGRIFDYSFQHLIRIRAKQKNAEKLFETIERLKENQLFSMLTGKNHPGQIPTLQTFQVAMPDDAAFLSYANGNEINGFIGLGITRGQTAIELHSASALTQELRGLDYYKLGKLAGSGSLVPDFLSRMLPLIHYMQIYYGTGSTRGFNKRQNPDSTATSNAARIAVGKLLYRTYIKPYESLIAGKKTLYISPDLQLHYIPFEAFIDEEGRYLVEKFRVVYFPSFTIREVIRNREYSTSDSMLAFGNPDYSAYHPELLSGKAFDDATNGVKWSDLEGTAKEIRELSLLLKGHTYTQNQLSETRIKDLASTGKLQNAGIIHFALHGYSNVFAGLEDNAIIVTEPNDGNEDGYLMFGEIWDLQIKARLVTLSACETSFGTPAKDGSNISLTSAFFAAGAASCVGSIWKIDDAITALFMKNFYQLVLAGKSYADAIAQTKIKFIRGEFGDRYKHPYYWASFKYIGAD